jgi:hypothetical protein
MSVFEASSQKLFKHLARAWWSISAPWTVVTSGHFRQREARGVRPRIPSRWTPTE